MTGIVPLYEGGIRIADAVSGMGSAAALFEDRRPSSAIEKLSRNRPRRSKQRTLERPGEGCDLSRKALVAALLVDAVRIAGEPRDVERLGDTATPATGASA
jgi:hypothetical protein